MPSGVSQNDGRPRFFPCSAEDSAPFLAYPDGPRPFQASTVHLRMLFEPYWYKAIRRVLPSQQYPQTPNLYGSKSMRRWTVFA